MRHRHTARKMMMMGGGPKPWEFNPSGTLTFTPSMAKRATSVFAASPIVQGKRDGTATSDLVYISPGTLVAGTAFYPNIDRNQGSICFRITPEWNGNDGVSHYLTPWNTGWISLYKSSGGILVLTNGNIADLMTTVDISGWVAGTTYNVIARWDSKNTLDGTNYACISINDTHTFGCTSAISLSSSLSGDGYLGTTSASASPANAIIEGLTIYRRVLYDGTYGVNVGNGDEVNLISAGVDPTTITGSWDVVFCLPTNATAGALTTGTGNAWSHPHSSNLLTRGFLSDSYYGGGQWGVKFNGTTTKIDCGSGATLDDIPNGAVLQVEGWFRWDGAAIQTLVSKGGISTATGWNLYLDASGYPIMLVDLATTNATATHTTSVKDGKWHHIVGSYTDATRIARVAIDGIWGAAGSAGDGAYVTDAALNLNIGMATSGTAYYFSGSMGWINIHNDAHYTPGTNFLPVRAAPAADVEEWLLNEGTGTTATAQVTAPGNNGTITAGTWEQQWYDEGTPVRLRSVVGGASFVGTITRDAGIDNIADAAFTVDGWVRICKNAAVQVLSYKGNYTSTGWYLRVNAAGTLEGKVYCATTAANSISTNLVNDCYWHYVKMTFNDAGDRKIDLFIDNVEATYGTETAGNAVVDDSASNGFISNATTPILSTGAVGWMRWSNNVRGAGMLPRSNAPAADGNTLAQYNFTEGAGATVDNAETTASRDLALTGTYTWQNSPAMESDSPGARNYAWGYVFGNDAADEGFLQNYTVVAGNDYRIRAIAYSEDGVGQPEVVVYDNTGSAVIVTATGTTTSTEKTPDVLEAAFEAPAGCTSIAVKIINTVATGVVGFQKVMLLANLLDDPGFETGTAVTAIGTPSTSAQSNEQAHTDTNSWKIVTDAADEGFSKDITVTANKYYLIAGWVYDATAGKTVTLTATHAVLQASASANTVATTTVGSWVRLSGVFRAAATTVHVGFTASSGTTFYVDDVSAIALDDVSLTVTPASAANSVESSGVRVDGLDVCSQTIPAGQIQSGSGWLKFKYIPRHSAADVAKFGNATPAITQIYGGANDYITLDYSAANTMRLRYNANGAGVQTGTWDCTGAIVAGTTYIIEVRYTSGGMKVYVDGTERISISAAVAFGTVPTMFYAGQLQAGTSQNDCVLLK
jgi:hypothetical protein